MLINGRYARSRAVASTTAHERPHTAVSGSRRPSKDLVGASSFGDLPSGFATIRPVSASRVIQEPIDDSAVVKVQPEKAFNTRPAPQLLGRALLMRYQTGRFAAPGVYKDPSETYRQVAEFIRKDNMRRRPAAIVSVFRQQKLLQEKSPVSQKVFGLDGRMMRIGNKTERTVTSQIWRPVESLSLSATKRIPSRLFSTTPGPHRYKNRTPAEPSDDVSSATGMVESMILEPKEDQDCKLPDGQTLSYGEALSKYYHNVQKTASLTDQSSINSVMPQWNNGNHQSNRVRFHPPSEILNIRNSSAGSTDALDLITKNSTRVAVFVSFHESQKLFVKEICKLLRKRFDVIFGEKGDPNELYHDTEHKIIHSDIALICFSANFGSCPNCVRESVLIQDLSKPWIGLQLIEDEPPAAWILSLLNTTAKSFLPISARTLEHDVNRIRISINAITQQAGTVAKRRGSMG